VNLETANGPKLAKRKKLPKRAIMVNGKLKVLFGDGGLKEPNCQTPIRLRHPRRTQGCGAAGTALLYTGPSIPGWIQSSPGLGLVFVTRDYSELVKTTRFLLFCADEPIEDRCYQNHRSDDRGYSHGPSSFLAAFRRRLRTARRRTPMNAFCLRPL